MKKPETSSVDRPKFSDEEIEKELQLRKSQDLLKKSDEPSAALNPRYYEKTQTDVHKTINPENFDLKK
jgi:hypothetical protein